LERFSKFKDKIIHIVDDELNPSPTVIITGRFDDEVWKNENHQRNSIHKGIASLKLSLDDVVCICDVDEIPNPKLYTFVKSRNKRIDYFSLEMDMYYYNLTCKHTQKWIFPKIMSYDTYINKLNSTPQKTRTMHTTDTIKQSGWHLSYFGSPEFIQNKLKEFGHQEFNQEQFTNPDAIAERIKENKDLFSRSEVPILKLPLRDNTFLPPEYNTYLSKYLGNTE
jgi:hypothetical protein